MNSDNSEHSLDLYTYAINYNVLALLERMAYGTKSDFIRDKMEKCLKINIISEYVSNDPFWVENDIQIVDTEYIYKTLPDYMTPLQYNTYDEDSTKNSNKDNKQLQEINKIKWDFDIEFKKVMLPENYTFELGCGCGRNMVVDSFSCLKDGEIVKTFTYFENFNIYAEKSKYEIMGDVYEDKY